MPEWSTKVLWAKKSKNNQDRGWLPLVVHMSDAAEIAKLVWRDWLPYCTKEKIAQGIYKSQKNFTDSEDAALPSFVFLAAAHDFGKATPAFQSKLNNTDFDEALRQQIIDIGLPLSNNNYPRETRHFWSSQVILEHYEFHRKLAVILGGHHGLPPSHAQLYNLRTAYRKDLGWGKGQEGWSIVQDELLAYALELAGVSKQEAQSWQPNIIAQVLLSGLVIMVDWIVSNEEFFPYIDLSSRVQLSSERAEAAWKELSLPECWRPNNAWMRGGLFEERFNFKPRPVQTTMLQIFREVLHPGIVILEAPMGEGKTEAALAAAELMADKTKRSGIFFALPTQASANGLFLRICRWISKLEDGVNHSVQLSHGKANLNELYNEIKDASNDLGSYWVGGEEGEETGDDSVIVHEWFSGRKKGILADFVIGTIDQVLMGGLKQKHLAMRHLGLANKVVILDECHAYDAYMSQYLYKVLNWLGAYNVPVIVLSATLPGEKRKQLIDAYLNKECAPVLEYDPVLDTKEPEVFPLPAWATTYDYPIITFSDGCHVKQEKINGEQRQFKVTLKVLSDDEQLVALLEDLLSEGGCVGIIVNTVKRAQKIAHELIQHFGGEYVQLLHSRFISMDRAQKEKELFAKLGADGKRPQRCIVIGTQIFEQSCDLDFDVLISDICPMDLLIQRIGRLHRHKRDRSPKLSQAQCYITGMDDSGFDRGAELIYGKYLLMNTKRLLPKYIMLPTDIPQLVQKTYTPEGLPMPTELQEEYIEAKSKHEQRIAKKIAKSRDFQISDPYKRTEDLVGWLDTSIRDDPSGKRGEATVRDTEDSLEVLVVQRCHNKYYMLPWLSKFGGRIIPIDIPPEIELARAIAECSIQLPRELCWKIDETISELEKISLQELWTWQQSPWLKGELFLVLDEQLSTDLCGYHLHYDQSYGMLSKKIEKGDVNAGKDI
ncbi:MAG: CRISPR-associated helicase Cas3' [Desulfitobacteriaceae bacterium]|nr:CRISPR-associated helicase Cas3' [Desulfitobacteriaceae bacterium]